MEIKIEKGKMLQILLGLWSGELIFECLVHRLQEREMECESNM